jgi:hypothetical protein
MQISREQLQDVHQLIRKLLQLSLIAMSDLGKKHQQLLKVLVVGIWIELEYLNESPIVSVLLVKLESRGLGISMVD